MEKQHQLKHGN